MSTPPLALWAATACDATFTDPAACAARASAFERQIARRNRRERIAGRIQLPIWGALAAFFLWQGEWLIAASLVLIGAGVLLVLHNLRKRAGNLAPHPEEPCLTHLARQYRHQHDALMSVPLWYIGPLVPGVIAFFGIVTARVAERRGWEAALDGLFVPAAAVIGLFGVVVILNLLAARQIRRELDRINRLA